MALDTYAALQASILSWLGRPADPLVSPSIPDIIQLFEHEADRRLKVAGAEKRVSLTAISAAVALPADFGQLRLATSGGVILTYVTPMQLPDGGGPPAHYTIIGNEMRLGPSPSATCTIEIVYQSGVPPLSDTNTSNWLLTQHPDCYLFGSLVEAESFIGSDERIPLWAQRREAAFASIETADRKARWGGAPLSIRAEGVSGGNGTAAGDWTSAPPLAIPTLSAGTGITLTPSPIVASGSVALTVPVTVANGGTGGTTAAAARASLGAVNIAGDTMTGNLTVPNLGIGTSTLGSSKLLVHIGTDQNFSASLNASLTTIGALNDAASGWVPLVINPAANVYLSTSGGNVGVGTTGPAAKLHVSGGDVNNLAYISGATRAIRIGATSTTATIDCVDMPVTTIQPLTIGGSSTLMTAASGVAVGSPTGGAIGLGKLNAVEVRANNVVLTSDADLKADIEPLPAALPLVQQIEPKSFRWLPLPDVESVSIDGEATMIPATASDFTERLNRGFIAQEVAEALGGAVEDGVDLGGMVAVLWQAVRELSGRVRELEDKPAEPAT